MDENHLATLICNAMRAFNEFVRTRSFPSETLYILRPNNASGSSHSSQPLPRPNLRDALLTLHAERTELPSAKILLDYLWEHGGHRITLYQDNGNPGRAAWASNAFHMIVALSMWNLWNEHSIRNLSSTGTWAAWEVPSDEIDVLAKDIASIQVGKGGKVKITVPLLGLTLADEKEFQLAQGITLRTWTKEDREFFSQKDGRTYPYYAAARLDVSDCYLEIVANEHQVFIDGKTQEALEDFVESTVARVKWSLMQATNPVHVIYELPATTEIQASIFGFSPIYRGSVRHKPCAKMNFDTDSGQQAAKLLEMLSNALKSYHDLQDVMWLFDRATLAVLPRDILLESVTGLERLLVAGNGDSTRRFRTYGEALINDSTATAKHLSEIYDLRSTAAHGGGKDPKKFESFNVEARAYLAKAITNVVGLIVSSKIQPLKKDEKINISIERYLTSLMYGAVQKDLNQANVTDAPATLEQRLALFEPARREGEAMISKPVGAER